MPRQEIVGRDLVRREMAVDGSRRMEFARRDNSIRERDLPNAPPAAVSPLNSLFQAFSGARPLH